MRDQVVKISLVIIAIAACVALGIYVGNQRSAPAANTASTETSTSAEQIDDPPSKNVEPDVNNQEFRLTASNVSCTSTTINGQSNGGCSGNIRVIPRGQADMEPGLYQINDQTRLLHNGQEESLNNLSKLVDNNTVVRLKLADGSLGVLTAITY
jgi:hypothetical protein